jgi:hypothetical protein
MNNSTNINYYKIMKKVIAFVLVALFTVSGVFAQTSWKSARHSINWGIGANVAETDVCPYEGHKIPWKTRNGSFQLGYEYRLSERFSLRGNFLVSRLQAYDADAYDNFKWVYDKEKNPTGRNLNFRTWMFDIDVMANFYFLKMKDISSETTFGQRWGGYITAGFGAAAYTTKCGIRNGSQTVWVHARALNVEKHKDPDYPRNGTVTIPYGLGFKYQFSKNFNMGIELLQHYCLSDCIDNVSGSPVVEINGNGTIANMQRAVAGNGAKAGVGRTKSAQDDGYNDQYTTCLLTFSYTFAPCMAKHVARPKYLN